ncbi:hypothetical protein ED208_02625 [Stagnimonas aquatica]|uniref:Uncharacterized protein n=1 Tax=Stagnimonas aquatica TaxID=2689987 RepID=A0A3N0VKX8_9GAMM|nr:hypothetical protein [Stagnimonas aquatica]ROH93432.1 hypothetical protein ED208_02625 [Stagnimonas aquatica]
MTTPKHPGPSFASPASHRRWHRPLGPLLLASSLWLVACESGEAPSTDDGPGAVAERAAPTLESRLPGIRTVPDPLCLEEYAGTTGLLTPSLLDADQYNALEGGAEAAPEVARELPGVVHLRGRQQSFDGEHYYAVHEGRIYLKANRETTGIDQPWRALRLPRCLDGQVSEISADGSVLLALNQARQIYTLDYANGAIGAGGWTRRWGPFFWTDLGGWIFEDVRDWATTHFTGSDEYFVDGGGYKQAPAGILNVFLLRGDGLRITYLDPWLPMDQSREVCGPERGTTVMAGLSGSGSTAMVVAADGEIYTRLYEFDVSGGNAIFLDYSWQDQRELAQPKIQLPPPDWIHHPRVPGRITDRISLRKLPPGSEHRLMRVEGLDASGNSGYWEKDQADSSARAWRFVATGEPLQGRLLPLPQPHRGQAEDYQYQGRLDGYSAELLDFNPYCSPARLRVDVAGEAVELELHSTDGLRQERRARGLDLYPRYYRAAVKVPEPLWQTRSQRSAAVQAFLNKHFAERPVLETELYATLGQVRIAQACWTLSRDPGNLLDALTQPPLLDPGTVLAILLAQQEDGRQPPLCLL